MISFNSFIAEAADSKQNLHLTHSEEDIYERGNVGAQAAVSFIEDFVETLGKGQTKITVKWDGSPAIFCGTDPEDGKFFVGTKSVFAKTPKVYKTAKDIRDNESGGKADKLLVALEELSKIGIPKDTVLQGDLLWTPGDFRYESIDGERYLTVHPNTIVYAWPSESDIAKRIRQTRLGIVFHTTYRGRGVLANYRATFGANVNRLKQTKTCWFDDAFFKGVDIAFTEAEHKEVMDNLNKAKKLIGNFDKIVSVMDSIPSTAAGANIKTFINSYIRTGKYPSSATAYKEYIQYLKTYYEDKVISKVKSDTAKDSKRGQLQQLLQDINNHKKTFQQSFEYVEYITKAKMIVINKLNSLMKDKTFVKTKDGFKVTPVEGFVAIDTKSGAAVKFVDRLTFSWSNFNPEILKGWMR
ncbi:MAG: hypothetical protein N0C84_00440 [Candidatus Thiodiazotropha taylori]|uniref:Uncharacterized protein n=1 Tax=Candidatus Thiodiazotropha taylori TaxID=2792791 RepID=A0A9E4K9D1_9GAMM|nr:hypothetical protein [Candidatus Thiodiazotropha taylori]MCW4254912.1 hypothetical protein [Candidatus Thiodiazotropha taylori]